MRHSVAALCGAPLQVPDYLAVVPGVSPPANLLVDGGVLQFRSTFTDSRVLSTLALEVGMAVLLVLVHWNQGVLALVSVLPFAVLLTGYFVLTRRLWPVVVAHVANNAIGLGACVGGDS